VTEREEFEAIMEQLEYDAQTGIFRWKKSKGRASSGSVAGYARPNRYVSIKVNGKQYSGHRLAWIISYGVDPELEIDHINNDPHDNRLSNLRLATREQNSFNTPIGRRNKSGVKGVYFDKNENKWAAEITTNGRRILVGRFKSIELAEAAIKEKRLDLHGEFANHG